MSKFMQEKFQITAPPSKVDDGGNWTTFAAARESQFNPNVKTNWLPPGMDIGSQEFTQQENMPLSIAGETDVSHMGAKLASQGPRAGFHRFPMKGTDDLYTGEHADLFYGEAVGQDDTNQTYTGFVERNNYLDRS